MEPPELNFFGKVVRGVLHIINRRLFDEELRGLEGVNVELRVRKKRSYRSLPQNSYLHALFTILSKELINLTGDDKYTKQFVKDMLKVKFLLEDVLDKDTGEIIAQTIKPTHTLKVSEFADFTSQIIRWSQEQFGIRLPMPEEQINLYD